MKQQQAQQPGVMTPTPKKRKNFRKRLLKKESSTSTSNMISGPSDFRHNICLTPSRTEMSKTEIALANVPGDAVKGKTWGPSTASTHVKQRPTIVPPGERGGQGRWKATSAPSLEKSPRSHVTVPSVGTVPEAYEEVIYFHPSLSEYCIQYQPARLLSPRLSMRLSYDVS